MTDINVFGRTYKNCQITFGYYMDGSLAMRIFTEIGEILDTPSINLGDHGWTPADGCIFVKDYAGGAEMIDALTDANILERTGKQVTFGPFHTTASEVRIIEKETGQQ